MRSEARKTFGCCCWESDPLRIYNVLPYLGFVPGERVQYSLELNNDSDVSISSAHVKLVEKIVYHTHSPRSKTRENYRTIWEKEIISHDRQLVAAMQNKVYSTEIYFYSPDGFHFFDGSGIITVEYYLKAEARTSGCHTNLSNYTSITMGTVPFVNYGVPMAPMAPMVPMPFPSAPADNASAPPAEPISEQPLPSYNDTMSKPGILPPLATDIGWAGANNVETRKKIG